MSLINDALKRAKQSQPPANPPPSQHLHFQPVESDAPVRHGVGFLIPIALGLIALVGLFFVWELAHKNPAPTHQPELVARAVSSTTLPPAPTANPAPPAATEPPPATPSVSEPEPAPAVTAPALPEPAPAPAPAEPAPTVTEEPAAAAPAPPKPAPLRLQGIVFNPARPSAVINGKTVFVGDKVGEFRVSSITQDSAVLFSSSQTNTLTLSE